MTDNRHSKKTSATAASVNDGKPNQLPMFQMANLANPLVSLVHMQAMGMRTILTQQNEMMKFLQRRCDHDLQLLDTIVSAQEPQGMVELVADFYRTAARDYSSEMERSLENGPRVATAIGEAASELVKSAVEQTASPAA